MVSAMQKYAIIAAAFTIALLTSLNGAVAGVLIAVDERSQTMSVAVDGVEAYRWKVSTGRAGYDTPTGTFRPFRMERDHFSKEWDDAPMPYSIFFTPDGHAIHGSLETRRLGRAVSHGCIRLDPRNAAVLYDLVTAEGLGRTQVVVTNGGDPSLVAQARAPQTLATLIRKGDLAPTLSGELY
jgi:lipoprotein-anchoring transpeptidase ErfK/SrfK